ncbi:MAG: glutamate synthase-related protein, partial [bacterium]
GLKSDGDPVPASEVDASIGHHDYPLVISSMRFGSQSEPAFRSYADAAREVNILCINGEGGEIRDMYGEYRKWRGQQVASGRFGVSAEMLNASYVAEIKIGQGAKPGEGGHLPGKKVSAKVAAARNAAPGTDLISPSNNHDLYSIEDLAELIDELKTVNPDLRVSVKVPVVPNIGTIGLGIAKAGADIITLSGFEGGTGAARQHALRHVGLPSDIGTRAVHQALMEAGIRNRVEIWADGGYRHAHDVVKLLCLGANRVGFGTLAMVSLGCTICRGCQLDTCHVGIATQIETEEEASEHGLKKFTPQEVSVAAANCARFFGQMGEQVKEVVGSLGHSRAQDLVGRYDLLEQISHHDRLDLAPLITPLETYLDLEPIDMPAVAEIEEDRAEAGLVMARPIRMEPKASSEQFAPLAREVCSGGTVSNEFPRATDADDRVLGTELSGALARARVAGEIPLGSDEGVEPVLAELTFNGGSVAGQGFGAFNSYGVVCRIEGGAQDGAAKTMLGGTIAILKGRSEDGTRLNGSVGKSFAYGAQRGQLFVQGSADSRFCIRLSGADVVLGGEPEEPIDDERGCLVDRANAKGFAFEYMTGGRAVVLGDLGPWACAGMTGGRVYVRISSEMGMDRDAIERRLGKGAMVNVEQLDETGAGDISELLGGYAEQLRETGQTDEADRVLELAGNAGDNFLMIVPEKVQADPSISTE